ncbi:hypothetical protein CS022_21690 [Veronia nyctiphanis]|uniref:Uncharacterized protein n=1 Tax=Veronia nyctiphanis TaxID=1278244 RepID=A0A4Q0YME7_9GAMM|nr:hypothetical protein [Veronia nyctiphanis]RXJ71154.1 hypothetical protein CS022_21690 [Veronia nyctiphanis]
MKTPRFTVPYFSDFVIGKVSYGRLIRKMPDFISMAKWNIRFGVSSLFLFFTLMVSATIIFHGLSHESFYQTLLCIELISYVIALPLITHIASKQQWLKDWINNARRKHINNKLTKLTLRDRVVAANRVWKMLQHPKWKECISYAYASDPKTAQSCYQNIRKVLINMTSDKPTIYCDASWRLLSDKRGSIRYQLDVLVTLANRHYQTLQNRKPRGNPAGTVIEGEFQRKSG